MLSRNIIKRCFSLNKTPGDWVLPSNIKPPNHGVNEDMVQKYAHILFDYKPLVVCGSFCSGKSATIDHLRYTYDKMTLIAPYTTRKHFYHGESLEHDYLKASPADFDPADPEWLLIEKHQPPQNALKDKLISGIRIASVVEQSRNKKISLIEVSSLDAARQLHEEALFKMNFIYIMPENMELVKKTMIRERLGTETGKSLDERIKRAMLEIQKAKEAEWIDKVFINDFTENYLQESATYIWKEIYD